MRLACGICKARSPEFKVTNIEFTWVCGACMKSNIWTPPKPKKPKREKIEPEKVALEEVLEDLVDIGEKDDETE